MSETTLSRSRHSHGTLVEQLVEAVQADIAAGRCAPGTVLPSVRAQARLRGVSPYTVAEAYQRLVSMGRIVARPGARHRVAEAGPPPPAPARPPPGLNAAWLLSDVFADRAVPIKAGCGWLPNHWINESGLQHALRGLARMPGARLGGYGHPYGLESLRSHIAGALRRLALPADTSHVLLTQGATQAIDLIVRTLLRPGDAVLVEDPGYCNLLQILRLARVRVLSVPRTRDGLDLEVLERLVREHAPKALFVNTVLQNPSGASLSLNAAFRLLQLADRHGLWVIEDDISRELAPAGSPCLAAMAGLSQVIYVSGFSKTITPAARVGYVVAGHELLAQLALTKMAVGLTSSALAEQAVLKVLVEGHYERHVAQVRERLAQAHARVEAGMQQAGIACFHTPRAGLFLWGQLPICATRSHALCNEALGQGIWLAPGSYFRPDEAPSAWFRFNVAYADEPALWRFLAEAARR